MMRTKLLVAMISMGLVGGVAFAPDTQAGQLKSWSNKIENPKVRFKSVFDTGEGVLDKETELTWEIIPESQAMLFWQAQLKCYEKIIAERRGWRLPTVDELMTLSAPSSNGTVGLLPDTLPFNTGPKLPLENWWTSTESALSGILAVRREGTGGAVLPISTSDTARFICVRGPGTARGAK